MNIRDIITLRLINQQRAGTKFNTAKELVGWMGAMQAQDYNQAKWAIGVRLPHLTEQQIESAFNKCEIFRTHMMRPTWHFVSSDDIYWFAQSDTLTEALPDSVYLLPAFDEFLISYKNRSAVITAQDHKKAISDNGIFRPVVLVNGQISGLWKRTIKKETAVIETEYFRPHNKTEEHLMAKAANLFGHFSAKKAEIKFTEMQP